MTRTESTDALPCAERPYGHNPSVPVCDCGYRWEYRAGAVYTTAEVRNKFSALYGDAGYFEKVEVSR